MMSDRRTAAVLMLVLSTSPTVRLSAQSDIDRLAARFAAMTAVTGLEQSMVDSLRALFPGSTRDRAGNVTLTLGQGSPKRLCTCPLDEVGFVVDNAYVDVGAASAAEVQGLGIAVLAPVSLAKRPQLYGERLLAAPSAGRRIACAALAAAVQAKPKVRGTVVVAFTVQSLYTSNAGLASLKAVLGPFDDIKTAALPARYPDTAVETVALADAEAVLAPLVETYGVSSAEGPVREAVKRLLPGWAKSETDTAGNLWVRVGEGSPVVVFIAHS